MGGDGATAENGKVDFVRFETEGLDGANPITLLYRWVFPVIYPCGYHLMVAQPWPL